ncbi:hypothetical protein [Georgenia sp. Z1491]|uniref:hypothetical protein n=1 Tax=Georgenia sp. Z1491 TaxID=3416707 RepID=UPI003CEAF10E
MTSPAPTAPGPQPITRGAIVDNAPVLVLITVGVALVGAFGGLSVGGGSVAWTIGGFGIGLALTALIFWLTLRPYVRVDVDLGAGTVAAKGRTVPLNEIDQLHIGPSSFGMLGKPGVHMAFGRGTDVVAPVYLKGAPLRRIPRPQAQLLAEAIHRTSATPAPDAVEALVAGGFIDRPTWHEVPDPTRPEGMVRYLLVGPLTGRPDPDGLARVAGNLSLPVETLATAIRGSVRASREVAEALAGAGIQVERLQGHDDAASGGKAQGEETVDPAVLTERARAVTVLTEGPRDLTGVTGADSTAAVYEYAALVNPAGARQMIEQLAAARPADRERQLEADPGLRRVWERHAQAHGNGTTAG